MIQCRIFLGFKNLQGEYIEFDQQGRNETLYVIDELAIKGFKKHGDLHLYPDASEFVDSEFREEENYGIAEFIDKFVRPIIIQEHFGVRTTFRFNSLESRRAFARYWRVAVNVPETARSIPDGATGVLVPKPYESKTPPSATVIKEGLDDIDVDTG